MNKFFDIQRFAESIFGTSSNDTIFNDATFNHLANAVIIAGAGDDYILNLFPNVTINAGDGADFIQSAGGHNYVYGEAGNDYIILSGKDSFTVNGGTGNDTIIHGGNGDVLYQYSNGDGYDIIEVKSNDALKITGSTYTSQKSGDDIFISLGSGAITLKGGAKVNLSIIGEYSNFFPGTDSADSIQNIDNNATIFSYDGDDTVYNWGDLVTINTGAGNDFIDNYGDEVTIDSSENNDFIQNSGKNVLINSGNGDDSVRNAYTSVTINAGVGNDLIDNNGDSLSIYGNSGNDTIENAGQYVTINGDDGKDSISNNGNTCLIDGGEGNDNIHNEARGIYATINGGNGDDMILNNAVITKIYGGAGNDSIDNGASKVTIDAGIGNDTIALYGGSSVSAYGGAGDDFIDDFNSNMTINGGSGNDTVSLGNYSVNNLIQYVYGDGNDIIYGINSSDTLHITGGNISSAGISNADVILYVGNGSITLKDMAEQSFYLKIANGLTNNTVINREDPLPAGWKIASTLATATLTSADDLDLNEDYGANIKNVDASKITSGIIIYGNSKNNSIKGSKGADEIYGGAGNDTVSLGGGKDTYIYSGGDDLIQDYTVAQDVIKFETDIQSASLSGSNLIITTDEGKLTIKNGKNKNISVINSNDEKLNILNEYPVEEITLPAGWKFGTSSKTNTNAEIITATLKTAEDIDLTESYGEGVYTVDASKVSSVEIIGNSKNNSIKGSKGQDCISGGAGNDTVSLGAGMDVYIYSGGNDLIQDYLTGTDSIQVEIDGMNYSNANEFMTSIISGQNVIFQTSKGNLTVIKNSDKKITLMDENGMEISLGETLPEGWKFGTSSKTNTNTAIITATISSAEKEIYLSDDYGVEVEKVDASKISDAFIIGNDLDNSIKAGGGNDELDGGAGNDTLTGGKGDDIFIYSGGDDIITDYGTGNDSVQIASDIEFTAYETLKSDVIYYTNEGTLTIRNAIKSGKVKNIILMDEGGEEIIFPDKLPAGWQYNSAKNEIIANVNSAEDIDLNESYGAGVEIVDGAETNGVKIFGNDLDNSLKGGTGNNTLDGGEGNDTLDGNTGADVFIYSEGDDRIINYSSNDSIQIAVDNISKNTTEKITREIDGDDVIYYIDGAGMLTVQNAKDEKIKLMDSNGTELILTTPPRGWKFDSAKNLLQATVSSAENEIDLTEAYGDGVQKVDGSKISGGVEIIGNDLNNSLKGGRGNDYLDGGAGNDTLTSGAGDDLFIYTGGDDYFTDYTAGKDSIQVDINEIEIYSAETVGANVVYHTDAGKITVKNGKGKNITLIDADDEEIIIGGVKIPEGWQLDSVKHILKATVAGADNEIDLSEAYGAEVEKVDAVKISGGVEIYGNDLDNSIKSGKGNDYLDGGSGNDTLTGGAGADTYVYSGGDDLITDYAAVDAIQFDTGNISITNRATVGSNVVFSTDAGTLTVKNAKTKKITLLDSNGEEFKYTNSSKNVAEENIWFLEDDNNLETCAIDSITENKFAVTDIQNYNDNFAQDATLLTFAKDK